MGEPIRWKHWSVPSCGKCTKGLCMCSIICSQCGDILGHYKDQLRPERCTACMNEMPSVFGHLQPTGDRKVDNRRRRLLPAALIWWLDRFEIAEPPNMSSVVVRIARELDRGHAEGKRPAEVIGNAAQYVPNCADAKFQCGIFADKFGGDLELLVITWCASKHAIPGATSVAR